MREETTSVMQIRNGLRGTPDRFRSMMPTGLALSASGTFATRVIGVAIGVVTSVLVARALGPDGRGLSAAALTLITVAVQLMCLGLHSSNTYFVARDSRILPGLVANSLLVSLGLGTLGALLTVIAIGELVADTSFDPAMLALIVVGIPAGLATLFFQNLLLGIHKIRWFNVIELLSRLVVLSLVVALILNLRASPETIVASSVSASLVAGALAFVILMRAGGRPLRASVDLLRAQLPYGAKAYLASLFAYLLLKGDLLLVQHIVGPTDAGYYAVAGSMADFLYLLPATVALVLFPRLAALPSDAQRYAYTRRVGMYVTVSMVCLALISILFASPVIEVLFGPEFQPAVAPFTLLAVGAVFYGVNGIVSAFVAALGFPWFGVWVWALVLIPSVIVNILLLPRYGIVASAAISVLAYASILVGQLWFIASKGYRNAG